MGRDDETEPELVGYINEHVTDQYLRELNDILERRESTSAEPLASQLESHIKNLYKKLKDGDLPDEEGKRILQEAVDFMEKVLSEKDAKTQKEYQRNGRNIYTKLKKLRAHYKAKKGS
ncbi:hypothetical protein ACFL1B_01160 [Nanoarchaeota archaeon]